MDPEERVIGSIESLEAQLEIAREFVRLKKWTNLGSVVQSIARTASCLAETTSTAKLEHPAAFSRHAGSPKT
jgi:hypothetical protein